MIKINGRDINLDAFRVKVERRRARGLLYEGEEAAVDQAGLDRGSSVEAQTYFGLEYRMHRSLAMHGARLEPPLDYGKGDGMSGFFGKLGRLRRKIRRKSITGPSEGYLQQQEQFNTYTVKCLDASARLFHAMRQETGFAGGEATGVTVDVRRPEDWSEEAVAGVLEALGGKLVFIGLPGATAYEKLLERGRLLAGVDSDDQTVAQYQALFLPARWQHPLDLLRTRDLGECGAVIVNQPETFAYDTLDQIVGEAAAATGPRAEVLLRVSRDGWLSPGGFVRAASSLDEPKWTAEFLAWLLERHGYEVAPLECSGVRFLRGARPAKEEESATETAEEIEAAEVVEEAEAVEVVEEIVMVEEEIEESGE